MISGESDNAVKAMVVRNMEVVSHCGIQEEEGMFGNTKESLRG